MPSNSTERIARLSTRMLRRVGDRKLRQLSPASGYSNVGSGGRTYGWGRRAPRVRKHVYALEETIEFQRRTLHSCIIQKASSMLEYPVRWAGGISGVPLRDLWRKGKKISAEVETGKGVWTTTYDLYMYHGGNGNSAIDISRIGRLLMDKNIKCRGRRTKRRYKRASMYFSRQRRR